MLSHVVIFYTKADLPGATENLLAGAERFLRPIPGLISFHVGRPVPSDRPVVESSYQVALNIQFADKAAEQAYQIHPEHLRFVEEAFKPNCERVVIYDFE